MGAVAVGALLFAVLIVVVAALVWQEARRAARPVPEYLLDEAAAFVMDCLCADAASRLGIDGVADLLLWGFEERRSRASAGDGDPAVYGSGDILEALVERSRAERGTAYDPFDVAEVIAAESEYLAAIGAVGDPVTEVET